uniref:Eukaryotic translation initiation factor 3 subunit H n=2 Tax=Clytia hemisphaerica TaxID=252671 RepID=A0A7M5X1J2_9CNID
PIFRSANKFCAIIMFVYLYVFQVALKIIKHCKEQGAGELSQGVLSGLLHNNTVEVTNCFPRPSNENNDFDEHLYQLEMLRKLREVNVDHFHVGWYQSTFLGSFLNKNFIESQFDYQQMAEESVVIVYDPLQTNQGNLSFKAYRLTKKLMQLYSGGDKSFTPEGLSSKGLDFHNILEEIPVTVRTSNLGNVLISEIIGSNPYNGKGDFMSLSTGSYLEKNVHSLIEGADELCQDAQKLHNYQRNVARQQQQIENYKQKRQHENDARKARGEAPLPEEDVNKIFRPNLPPNRLEHLLSTGQIATYCDHLTEYASQSFGKLFIAESVQKQSTEG